MEDSTGKTLWGLPIIESDLLAPGTIILGSGIIQRFSRTFRAHVVNGVVVLRERFSDLDNCPKCGAHDWYDGGDLFIRDRVKCKSCGSEYPQRELDKGRGEGAAARERVPVGVGTGLLTCGHDMGEGSACCYEDCVCGDCEDCKQ